MIAAALGTLGEPQRAVFHLECARELDPRNPDLLANLGNARLSLGDCAGAAQTYRESLAIRADHLSSTIGLINSLNAQTLLDEAESIGRDAALRWPDHPELLINRAATLLGSGCASESVSILSGILDRDPNHLVAADSLALALNYADDVSPAEILAAHRRYGSILKSQSPQSPPPVARPPAGKLRIGLLSADLREHSVAFFISSWLEHYDRDAFEIWCYSTSLREDAVTDRLRPLAMRWRTIPHLPILALAKAIREDRIDVLIDLSGHTAGHRLAVFQLRPAPIQATYLGYPATTGVQTMDARLVDALTDPHDAHTTEALRRMDGCFLCYNPGDLPPIAPRSDGPARVTLGSFNSLFKLSGRCISIWAAAMRAVPHARLLLKAEALSQPGVRAATAQRLIHAGIAENRFTLAGALPTRHEHLALYNSIDIALDTLPYNGTTTTCEALLMGVPVVSLKCDRHASRVGASLLTAAGYPELIAGTEDQVVSILCAMARPRPIAERQALRDRVRSSSLCDAPAFARRFDRALASLATRTRAPETR